MKFNLETYSKEEILKAATDSMNAQNVNTEIQELFKQMAWESGYNNMLSLKGFFFVYTFINNPEFNDTKLYEAKINIKDVKELDDIRAKLDKQGFVFFLDINNYSNKSSNLFIAQPAKDFEDKVAFFGGLEKFLEGLD